MGEITPASRELSAAIEQINQAMVQTDRFTQQSAALVEEASAAAALRDQAGGLVRLLRVVRVVCRLPYKIPRKSLHHYPTRLIVPQCELMHCVGIEGGV
nr:hypothetical protein [uncultured Duganella sp.]